MPASLYREHFQQADTAASYVGTYAGSTYDSLLWDIEREQITELIRRHARPDGTAVDCATGTGRVLSVLEGIYPDAVGIDSSLPMLEIARRRCERAELIHADLLDGLPKLGERPIAVVTAFRLLLNIEPDLRRTVLEHLRAALVAAPGAVLLVNNHGSTPSIKSVRRPRGSASYATAGNLLPERELRELLRETGWEVLEVAGCGVLGGRVAGLVGAETAAKLERAAAAAPRLSRFAINQLYVLRPSI